MIKLNLYSNNQSLIIKVVYSIIMMIVLCTAFVSHQLRASDTHESAFDQDQSEELIVLDKILKQNGQKIPVVGDVLDTATASDNTPKNNSTHRTEDHQGKQSKATKKEVDSLYLNEPVIDEARVLLASDKAALAQKLRSWHHQGLVQAAIVIVPTTGFEPIFDYGMKIAEKWKIGSKKYDNGLLILVAINDRKMHIFTGYGMEGALPDVATKRIIRDNITPYFKKRQYSQGLLSGLNAIEKRLLSDPDILAKSDDQRRLNENANEPGVSLGLVFFALIVGSILTSIFGRFFGSMLTAGGFTALSLVAGTALVSTLFAAFIVFILTLIGFLNLFAGSHGGSVGGGFGGSGGGDFGGGGGSFGGGGAGGSW